MNEGINIIDQSLSNTVKAVLKGECTAISANFRKLERHQVSGLIICLKELEKNNSEIIPKSTKTINNENMGEKKLNSAQKYNT